jgi:Pyruvate flavodoxin/ferredoxin oxidoreductase, thiamine diP-bdg
MSPSTLHWMAAHALKAGIMVRQVEDEIGVVNMAIGAAHAGVRSMCATSGGRFALMSEGRGDLPEARFWPTFGITGGIALIKGSHVTTYGMCRLFIPWKVAWQAH